MLENKSEVSYSGVCGEDGSENWGTKNLKNRIGVGKRKRHECEDLIMVYTLLDAQKADFPNFVTSNALRLSAFKIEYVDACQHENLVGSSERLKEPVQRS